MKGRNVPALPGLTLPESGIEVKIHPLGRFMLDEIGKAARKAIPEPEPPFPPLTLALLFTGLIILAVLMIAWFITHPMG